MRLKIKNIENIVDYKLSQLDGYSISWGKANEHEYEFDVFYNYTVKMVIKVNRDSNYNGRWDSDNYTCIITAGGIYNNHKWQVVLDRNKFKTKMGFLTVAGEMVEKLVTDMAMEDMKKVSMALTQSFQLPPF